MKEVEAVESTKRQSGKQSLSRPVPHFLEEKNGKMVVAISRAHPKSQLLKPEVGVGVADETRAEVSGVFFGRVVAMVKVAKVQVQVRYCSMCYERATTPVKNWA